MKKIIWLTIISIVAFFLLKGWWSSQLAAVSLDKSSQTFIIAKGESLTQIGNKLKKQNLIRNLWAFVIFGKQSAMSAKIQAGTFKIAASFSVPEIFKVITGQPVAFWVTLIEGWRAEEMADELSLKLKTQSFDPERSLRAQDKSSMFLKLAKEGYMFPDTYLFPPDITQEQIVQKLRETFDQKYKELKPKFASLGLTQDEAVILASIVEREARSEEVKTRVASILLKRYKIGMGLNADATVQYALGYQQKEKSWWKRHLSKEDLKIDSAYNTYLHAGLPPTPISNPGLVSLKAVANADPSTPYLYYYHDSKGNSHYAKTLDEHNQNVANNP
ncbi:endolytic transglycosylase MltG [Candidatus Daviesbacteria bacterium]|nr:endolytic transglycosylase MltG [Candidatus Daviesbacteria bacterium]